MSRLEEIRARAQVATPGPWKSYAGDVIIYGVDWYEPVICGSSNTPRGFSVAEPDLDFIAHAREDVPWLLEQMSNLTRERDTALALVERVAPFLSWLQGWVTDEGGDFIEAATGYEQAAIDIHKAMLNCAILEGDTE